MFLYMLENVTQKKRLGKQLHFGVFVYFTRLRFKSLGFDGLWAATENGVG